MTEIARLNDRWRVEDDGLQWILAVRRGRMDVVGTKVERETLPPL